jgi:hypothetical protein
MNTKNVITGLALASTFFLLACGSVQSAAQADCTAVGLKVGTPDFETCFKARVREREMDYSNQPLPTKY